MLKALTAFSWELQSSGYGGRSSVPFVSKGIKMLVRLAEHSELRTGELRSKKQEARSLATTQPDGKLRFSSVSCSLFYAF